MRRTYKYFKKWSLKNLILFLNWKRWEVAGREIIHVLQCKLLKEKDYLAQILYVGCTQWWWLTLASGGTGGYGGIKAGRQCWHIKWGGGGGADIFPFANEFLIPQCSKPTHIYRGWKRDILFLLRTNLGLWFKRK